MSFQVAVDLCKLNPISWDLCLLTLDDKNNLKLVLDHLIFFSFQVMILSLCTTKKISFVREK